MTEFFQAFVELFKLVRKRKYNQRKQLINSLYGAVSNVEVK